MFSRLASSQKDDTQITILTRKLLCCRHLQCTSAPTDDMKKLKPADSDDDCVDGCFSGMVRAIGKVGSEREAAQRLEQLHELGHFVRLTAGALGHYVVGGDFNIAGGSNDYTVATKIFGRESANAPEFKATFTTRSFLTPPGWKDVLWEANLDHMFTNLDICEFEVEGHIDISDHLPMRLVVAQPRRVETMEHIEHHFKIRSGSTSFATRCACTKICQGPCAKHTRIPKPLTRPMMMIDPPKNTVPLLFEDVPISP